MSHGNSASTIRAAGGVVWRVRDGDVQVAMVHRGRYDDWSLPKGKLERGESELAAAVREIGEELGSRVAVSRRLGRVAYPVGTDRKTVAYWSMRHLDGEFAVNDEVDDVLWLAVAQARARSSYPADREILDEFAALPVTDSIVVLVRHAKAGKRSEWSGPDDERPLEASGRAQARRLSSFLQRFAPDRVLSANPVRCVQTVAPLAGDLALDLAVDRAFGDDAYEDDPDATSAAVLALAKPRRVTVVCSQGATIPAVVSRLAPDVACAETRKGAAWVLGFVDGSVVSADYYRDAAR